MAKLTVRYTCNECGAAHAKWMGRCNGCGRWHTLQEEVVADGSSGGTRKKTAVGKAVPLAQVSAEAAPRQTTGISELDRVLGGGLVAGSVVLLGGEPGIGKSTLVLQCATSLANAGRKVLYITGEESAAQVGQRAARLGDVPEAVDVLAESRYEAAEAAAKESKPALLIVDSIQTIFTEDLPATSGSVSQVRECAVRLGAIAKAMNCAVLLIGHVTKEGSLAGPRVLEHLVDTVLTFEGDRHHSLRLLRAVKNRYGNTQELGLFEMTGKGLSAVDQPAALLLDEARRGQPGTAALACVEGTRPLIAEVQALVTPTHYGTPQRSCSGLDPYRLNLLYAVLEKRAGLQLYNHDTFVSVAGGLSLREPATDLAVALAVAGSMKNKALDPDWIFFGEIGLGGELRAVSQTPLRLKEAARLGFKHALLPAAGGELEDAGLTLHRVKDLHEALEKALG